MIELMQPTARKWDGSSFAASSSFLGKPAAVAGLRLSVTFSANMNEWQKVGSQKEAANDRMWVTYPAKPRLTDVEGAIGHRTVCESTISRI